MKIRYMLAGMLVAGAFVAPLRAQDTAAKKPGGLNKIARDVSKTAKKAGQDTKAEVHRDASKTHQVLQKAGNDTKTATGNATGIHKVGGDVGKAAQAVSTTSKTTGRKAKKAVKKTSSAAHNDLTKMGKAAKDSVKKP
ncbi:MAG: hypothetical protein JWM41_4233 [Gemmatimonadetes bacterium]|nr:hypothetical protein [Gemmatimonadota bacterium]